MSAPGVQAVDHGAAGAAHRLDAGPLGAEDSGARFGPPDETH